MQARFLLGPAGSGKTFRCLEEIRAELRREPEGVPLVLLAPKQATFQLERQLLGEGSLTGYTRLSIVSFERLAQFLIDEFSETPARLLPEDGRLMVLRALLARHHGELRLFRATARLPGFAAQLSLLLRDFQRHQLSPARLGVLAEALGDSLGDKLHDFAVVLRAYEQWLREHGLRDGNEVLAVATEILRDVATDARRAGVAAPVRLAGLWLDGFAEMTPQELDLLAALAPFCERATLAFCLEGRPIDEPGWLSTWSVVAQTFRACHARLAGVAGCEVVVEELARVPERGRFARRPVLAHLERCWSSPRAYIAPEENAAAAGQTQLAFASQFDDDTLRVFVCANPEAEAVLAAREILAHTRGGGRYRDCAVLVRQLRGYDRVLRRVFTRYEIPYFLDQRESVAHHPLAELTRFALRVAAFGWRREDWFGALKTGLTGVGDREIDWLENLALEHGWEGRGWRERQKVKGKRQKEGTGGADKISDGLSPIAESREVVVMEKAEALRARLVGPFARLEDRVGAGVSGRELAGALREFWGTLGVGAALEQWSVAAVAHPQFQIDEAMHRTVWRQMMAWVENLELAFGGEAMALREWLPILESGLGGLSVGVIPPALDQVLIGTIDRSRNPELRLALVLGLNESVFPPPPPPGVLLTDEERLELERREVYLGPSARQRLGHERYFGYIACTRSGGRLVLTSAAADGEGKPLNASPFLAQVGRMFPRVKMVEAPAEVDWREAEHGCEVLAPLLELDEARNLAGEFGAGELGKGEGEIPPLDSLVPIRLSSPLLAAGLHDAPETPAGGYAPPLPGPLLHPMEERETDNNLFPAPWRGIAELPMFAGFLAKGRALRERLGDEPLSRELIAALLGNELVTSVSKLEDFAACPFKFFVSRTLRGEERKEFEVDARLSGEFQHEVISEFHRRLQARGQRWRDVEAGAAWVLVREIGEALLPVFHEGVFQAQARNEFAARGLIDGLVKLAAALVDWMRQYEFDPVAVELGFGLRESALKGWRLELGDGHALVLRGRIDRVDVAREADGAALAVIIDYKSSARNFDELHLQHGLDLQLPAYLNALRNVPGVEAALGVGAVRPAGLFYVAFRGSPGAGKSRAEVLAGAEETRRAVFKHLGRFDRSVVARLDNRPGQVPGDQFRFKFKKDGTFSAVGCDGLAPEDFLGLLARNEQQLQAHGRGVFAGDIAVRPYRAGKETACDFCAYRAICRFDSWTSPFRVLRATKTGEESA